MPQLESENYILVQIPNRTETDIARELLKAADFPNGSVLRRFKKFNWNERI